MDPLSAFHVLARARVDSNLFAVLDEKRRLNVDAGFEGNGLLDVTG